MYDVVIVGAGPGGSSAAQMLGRSRRTVLLLDAGEPRNATAPEVHGVLSRDGAAPAELAHAGRAELEAYPDVEVRMMAAHTIDGQRGEFFVLLADGERVRARRVVLATGMLDELPDVAGLTERWGSSVLHCPYCHGWEVRDWPIAVLARSPFDAYVAAQLTQWSADVVLCPDGAQVADAERLVLAAVDVAVRDGRVVALEGPAPALERIVFDDGSALVRAALFVHAPLRQRSDLARRLGCRLLEDGAVEVDELGQTSVQGVYAVGDMARRATALPGMTYVAAAMAQGVVTAVGVNQDLFFSALALD